MLGSTIFSAFLTSLRFLFVASRKIQNKRFSKTKRRIGSNSKVLAHAKIVITTPHNYLSSCFFKSDQFYNQQLLLVLHLQKIGGSISFLPHNDGAFPLGFSIRAFAERDIAMYINSPGGAKK